MQEMTQDEARRFLLTGTRTAKLATVRADGRPHVAPVGFDLDGDDLVFTTGRDSVKAANLRREPRVAIAVDDERPPFAFVLVEGTARLSEDLDELRRWATRIAGRYVGADRAEEYGARAAILGEFLVRIRIEKIVGRTGIAD